MKPILGIFAGDDGVSVGYEQAGFDVVELESMRMIDFSRCAAIHASRPGQGLEQLRQLLLATGKPYVIEGAEGAPLVNPVRLVGSMLGLPVARPRWYEVNFPLPLIFDFPAGGTTDSVIVSPAYTKYIGQHLMEHLAHLKPKRTKRVVAWKKFADW